MPGKVGADRKLTKRQKMLATARVRNPDATLKELAEKAGYSDVNGAWQALQKPIVKERIRAILESTPKLKLKALTKKLAEGLDATETKFFAHEGQVVDQRETVDYGTRHRYLETALELHGAREKPGADGGVTNNFFTKEAIEAFVDAFKRKPPMSNGHAP